jgi:hypothetical protein
MTRDELRAEGFMFYCFTTTMARAMFSLRSLPEEYACVEVDDVLCKRFPVYFLAVRKLHHVPVKFTPAGG